MRRPRVVGLVVALALAPVGSAAARERAPAQPGDHMVRAGVGVLCAGVASYGLLAAGLGIGARAEQDIASASRAEDLERRRELLDRGRLGNRLAIAGGVLAAVAMGVGVPLVVVGRRRHLAAISRLELTPHPGGGMLGLRIRW